MIHHQLISPCANNNKLSDEADFENESSNDSEPSEADSKKGTDCSANHESSFESDKSHITTIDRQQSENLNKKRSFNVEALLAPDTRSIDLEQQDLDSFSAVKRFKPNENSDASSSLSILPNNFDHEEIFQKSSPNNNKPSQISPKLNKSQTNKAKVASNPTSSQKANFNYNNHNKQTNLTMYEQNSPFSKIESNNSDVEKWKQTFSKIMARSYKNNNQSNLISPNKK